MSQVTAVVPTSVSFHSNTLLTAEVNDAHYVAMKPIVDGMGLAWQVQHRKIADPRYNHMVIPFQTPGGIQEMVCIPITKLNGWLFSINPEKVKSEIREKVIQYQEECFVVLHDYWQKGEAVNPRSKIPADAPAPGCKRCGHCGNVKPVAEFSKNATTRDGLSSRCKECHNATMKLWRDRNRQKNLKQLPAPDWKKAVQEFTPKESTPNLLPDLFAVSYSTLTLWMLLSDFYFIHGAFQDSETARQISETSKTEARIIMRQLAGIINTLTGKPSTIPLPALPLPEDFNEQSEEVLKYVRITRRILESGHPAKTVFKAAVDAISYGMEERPKAGPQLTR